MDLRVLRQDLDDGQPMQQGEHDDPLGQREEAPAQYDAEQPRRPATAAERQRRSRARRREQALIAEENAHEFPPVSNDYVDRGLVRDISVRVEGFLLHELRRCPGKNTRDAVMESFLGAPNLRPHMPAFYPPPEDAKVQNEVLEGFRKQLDLVKGVQSKEMLAYRGAILDATVAGDTAGNARGKSTAISRVLRIRPQNILKATERRASIDTTGSSKFALPMRRKRSNALDTQVVEIVTSWWTKETRVSPNRKDTTRRRDGRNNYIVHPTHWLLETLVSKLSIALLSK